MHKAGKFDPVFVFQLSKTVRAFDGVYPV